MPLNCSATFTSNCSGLLHDVKLENKQLVSGLWTYMAVIGVESALYGEIHPAVYRFRHWVHLVMESSFGILIHYINISTLVRNMSCFPHWNTQIHLHPSIKGLRTKTNTALILVTSLMFIVSPLFTMLLPGWTQSPWRRICRAMLTMRDINSRLACNRYIIDLWRYVDLRKDRLVVILPRHEYSWYRFNCI